MNHRTGNRASLRNATAILDTYDTVSIQHEFGIWGPRDGIEVLDFISRLSVPTAVTLHTVLREPTRSQYAITERMCGLAERVVVMSQTASTRLVERYGVDPGRISVIAHGADPGFAGPSLVTGDRPLILTWGLIGPGKGLEWAIRALGDIADMRPLPRYLIAGATHPHVKQDSGETYRNSLMALTQSLGLGSMVEFDDRYLDRRSLARLVRSADVVVLPYESAEQVTSGVLVEAIAASKPVVATQFPHAVELLSGGAGAVVPYGEPHLLGRELRQILADQPTRDAMILRARHLATDWYWPTVGERFATIMSEIAATVAPYATPTPDRRRATG
jgi:glycosyltransferase involved in cell wall biosynthesis